MPKQKIQYRVVEISTTTGAGPLTLLGALAGFRTYGSAVLNGDAVSSYIEGVDASGIPTGEWEVSQGVWSTGGSLTRGRVFSSSNDGALVSFSAGTKRVSLTIPSRVLVVNSLGNQLARTSINYLG